MGSEVVVVKRNRRRAFALLWAVPAWVRGIAVGARTLLDAKETAASTRGDLSSGNALDVSSASLTIPALSWNEQGEHTCTGCQRCSEICPSRCLDIKGVSEAAGGQGVVGFALDLGRCIGCGDCVAVCPESALHTEPLGAGFYALAGEDPERQRDLLANGREQSGEA